MTNHLRTIMTGTVLLCGGLSCATAAVPPADLNLVLQAPITTWDEAIPLGNGLMGGLLWGEQHTIRLSLDRGDLWDERPAVEKEWWKTRTFAKAAELIAKKEFATVNDWWDGPYNGVTPTKLPAGRLEITLDPAKAIERFELNLATAEGLRALRGRHLQLDGLLQRGANRSPCCAFPARRQGDRPDPVRRRSGRRRYRSQQRRRGEPARLSAGRSTAAKATRSGTSRTPPTDCSTACASNHGARGDATLLAVAVTSTNDAADPLGLARKRCGDALAAGYAERCESRTPPGGAVLEAIVVSRCPPASWPSARQYHLVQYFYGAASRRGAPPMPLQGVWTADNGGLPPWKGDYHNDLNTQMTYIAYQTAGHFDEGLSYLDFLWNRRDVFAAFARDFYGTPGLACPA